MKKVVSVGAYGIANYFSRMYDVYDSPSFPNYGIYKRFYIPTY